MKALVPNHHPTHCAVTLPPPSLHGEQLIQCLTFNPSLPLSRPGKAALIHHVLLNKVLRIALMLFVGIAIPVLVFLIIFTRTIGPLQSFPVHSGTCSHPAQTHVPCGRVGYYFINPNSGEALPFPAFPEFSTRFLLFSLKKQ